MPDIITLLLSPTLVFVNPIDQFLSSVQYMLNIFLSLKILRNRTAPLVRRSNSPPETSIRSLSKNRKLAHSVPNLTSIQGINQLKKENDDEHRKQLKAIEVRLFLLNWLVASSILAVALLDNLSGCVFWKFVYRNNFVEINSVHRG